MIIKGFVLLFIEQQLLHQYTGTTPHLFLRYSDDIIGVANCTEEDLLHFMEFVNQFHPTLSYTWEIPNKQISFLNIMITINSNHLCTSVHYKSTDSHSYLTYTYIITSKVM